MPVERVVSDVLGQSSPHQQAKKGERMLGEIYNINIKEKNRKKLETALEEGQSQARERRVSIEDIFRACEEIEKKIGRFLSKKNMEGVTVTVDVNAQSFPSAYRYTPMATILEIRKKPTGWALVDVYRGVCTRNKFKPCFEARHITEMEKTISQPKFWQEI